MIKEDWHISRTVSISHMLATIAMAATLFSWASDVDKRIAGNAQAIIHHRELVDQHVTAMKADITEIKRGIEKLDHKFEKLIERTNGAR